MTDPAPPTDPTPRIRPDVGLRALLGVGLAMELVMVVAGLWPAAWLVRHYAPRADAAWQWVLLILAAGVVFNYGYLIALLVFRLIIPVPREGHYPVDPGGAVPLTVVTYMFNLLLVKARHDPPWSAMFSSVFTRLLPLGPLYRRWFGPNTSMQLGDVCMFVDPRLIEVGENVGFGLGAIVTAHHFDNRGMLIRKVKIGDHALIGGGSILMAGVEVGHHAVIAYGSVVTPNTRIGPYEYWGGTPARKIKDLGPTDDGESWNPECKATDRRTDGECRNPQPAIRDPQSSVEAPPS